MLKWRSFCNGDTRMLGKLAVMRHVKASDLEARSLVIENSTKIRMPGYASAMQELAIKPMPLLGR